jgi:hypothetical protein
LSRQNPAIDCRIVDERNLVAGVERRLGSGHWLSVVGWHRSPLSTSYDKLCTSSRRHAEILYDQVGCIWWA